MNDTELKNKKKLSQMDSIHEIGSELSFIHRKIKKNKFKVFYSLCYAFVAIQIKLLL